MNTQLSSMNIKEFRSHTEEANRELREYCIKNNIKNIKDKEFYFTMNGKQYRVSRCKIQLTEKETNSLPWIEASKCDIISIRIKDRYHLIDIYEALKEGKDLRSLKLKKRTVKAETATPVAEPEEKPVVPLTRPISKKQSALDSLLGSKRKS